MIHTVASSPTTSELSLPPRFVEQAEAYIANGVTAVIEPQASYTWEQFLTHTPKASVALDGYVRAAPMTDPNGDHYNFDHHWDVPRDTTPSTAMQITRAIMGGLRTRLRELRAYGRNGDADMAWSICELAFPEVIQDPKLAVHFWKLAPRQDKLDRRCGLVPIDPQNPIYRKMAYINQPYMDAVISGEVHRMSAFQTLSLLRATVARILRYCRGNGLESEVDTRFEHLSGGPGWIMAKEVGPYARAALARLRLHAICIVRDRGDGSYQYVFNSKSGFPRDRLARRLNEEAGLMPGSDNSWGGNPGLLASPMRTGCPIEPRSMANLVNDELARASH